MTAQSARPKKNGMDVGNGPRADGAASSPVYPQSARGKKTRAALVLAAREVFEESGWAEARVAEITQRANASYGSFYTYFESKDEIFREVIKTVTGEMFEASTVRDPAESTPYSRLRAANRRYLRTYERHARIMEVIEQVAPYDDFSKDLLSAIRGLFLGRIERGVRQQQSAGRLDQNLDSAVVARYLGGMIEQVARSSFVQGEPYDEDEAVHTLTTLWSNALGAVPGE